MDNISEKKEVKEAGYSILAGGKQEQREGEILKCFKSQLISVENLSVEELFSGYNSIKAITFSYDIGFINEIMSYFNYGQIILGGNFLVQKDGKLTELMAEIYTNSYEVAKYIRKYDRLKDMMVKEDIELRTPSFVLDHRKIYLLKSDDGRTRVIKASANMTKKAWNNDHMEHYEYDDTENCYIEYEKDFETAWELSSAVTMDVVSSKKEDDLIEGNAILKGVKDTGRTIVLKQPEVDMEIENIKYTIDHENIKEDYKSILKDLNPKSKNGMVEINPKNIEKIEYNQRKMIQKKLTIRNKEETYPALTMDISKEECYFNKKQMQLNPADEEIRNDINELIGIFDNFNQFVTSDIHKLQSTHFKLLNAIFCSPFNAKFRCAAKIKGLPTSSLPMFSLIASQEANSGKTFMINAALKMMTGKELSVDKAADFKKDDIRNAQVSIQGIPLFIDEIDNKYMSTIADIIKNPEKCEENQLEDMPMILFASNNVLKPEEPIRKRMVFFAIDGGLPSCIDKTAYESRGKSIIRRLGTGFYREYLRRMLEKTKEELEFIIYSKEIPEGYYTDLMSMSSKTIISIFKDYGYELPAYVKELTWENDYSSDSNADDTVAEIGEFCKNNRKACKITKEKIIISLGSDNESVKLIRAWKNILPAEMKATVQPGKTCYKIIIDKKEMEKRLGYRLGKIAFRVRK